MNFIDFGFFYMREDTLRKIIFTLGIFALAFILDTITRQLLKKHVKDETVRFKWMKTSNYIYAVVAIIVAGKIWFTGFHTLITFIGLLSAGIAIALKDIMLNIAGWIYIIWKKPFAIGQRIQVGDHKGDVVDIRTFQFIIMEIGNWVEAEQSTGRMIHVPNGFVFTHPIQNYETAFNHIWSELSVHVTFESNWQKAKQLLTEILYRTAPNLTDEAKEQIQESSNEYLINFHNFSPIVYTNITRTGVEFNLRFLCLPRERRTCESNIMEEVLNVFAEHKDINFAYLTTRFVNYPLERKDAEPQE
jgi:small-conductance mechanosensitive channel